jgi:two-component system, chemotaxis family, CheB/CheR fusion protein
MTSLAEQNNDLDALLAYVKRSRGFDFSGYKRASLVRRINKRMEGIHVHSYSEYVDYLEVHPEEFAVLFDTILINVTNFFRDPSAWEYIEKETIPAILASKKPTDPIRVWSAGCASGQEAYTIAILLAEALGVDQFKERVKIYASDLDQDALTQARMATYPARDMGGMPPEYVSKYFDCSEQRCSFHKDLRRSVIFGRLDLIQDAPISRVDLLICRNTLMYFNAETQARILSRFHFALNDTGFLFLGKAEMLFTHTNLFRPVDLRRRLFTKIGRATMRDRLLLMAQNDDENSTPAEHPSKHVRFREAAFDASVVAQIVVDQNGFLTLANERARSLLNLTTRDFGRPLLDLELSYRVPELKLRVQETFADSRPTVVKEANWTTGSGDIRTYEVQVAPLLDGNGGMIGVSITFTDVSQHKKLQEEVERSNQELETAYEELQSTNEELETTNEELQSTIEELETTNEELQSTNEELETINEELQSMNEELQSINEELRRRTEELNHVNGFLESILTSMRGGVVVVDKDFSVQVWNSRAEDLWGLRANEVQDKNFLNLDIGLPVDQLRKPIRECLSKESDFQQVTLAATNRRGKAIQCRVTCTPLLGLNSEEVRGAILLMEDEFSSQS